MTKSKAKKIVAMLKGDGNHGKPDALRVSHTNCVEIKELNPTTIVYC